MNISFDSELFREALFVANRLISAGATEVLFVGGCVRDSLMNIEPKDADLEVYGLNYDQITNALFGCALPLDFVGREFAIVKVGQYIDVSIPRRENRRGLGHRDFSIEPDPYMTPTEAAARRDFTVNALAATLDGEVIDFFGGLKSIENQELRATSFAFEEDPLRVFRAMQLASRLGFDLDPHMTINMCRRMRDGFAAISKERIWHEWRKWAMGKYPSLGLKVLKQTGWLEFFPELSVLSVTPQDPVWHPEGNVFLHTGHVCDAAATIATREELDDRERLILLMSALTHDFGKDPTTKLNDEGRWCAPGHAEAGVPLAKTFFKSINAPTWLIDAVCPLVKEHMVHLGITEVTTRLVRRLADRLAPATILQWSNLTEADHSGRPPLTPGKPAAEWVRIAAELEIMNSRPVLILRAAHLLDLGVPEGRRIGEILRAGYSAQLDGVFSTVPEAIQWAKKEFDL